ncbi:MAG: hypothetical protein IKB93_10950 [Clostridia bacterium]|nr:hypothetical protein [Clostridia bacterium]
MKKAENTQLVLSDRIPWSCAVKENGANTLETFPLISEQSVENGSIKVVIKTFSTTNSLIKAKRYEITAGGSTVFIFDKVLSQIPVNLRTKFHIRSGKDLRCNIADKSKLVIRQGGNAVKFFRLIYQADGEEVLKTASLMLPDGFCENGDMGLTYYSPMHNFAKEHTVLYGICSDTENRIAAWHFFDEEGFIVARPPSQIGGYRIAVSKEKLFIENLDALNDNIKVDI